MSRLPPPVSPRGRRQPRPGASASGGSGRLAEEVGTGAWEVLANEDHAARKTQLSLQISHDPRFKEISHFKDSEPVRLQRIVNGPGRLYPEAWGIPEPLGGRSGVRAERTTPRSGSHQPVADRRLLSDGEAVGNLDAHSVATREVSDFDRSTAERFSGRVNWELNFRSNLQKLMLDFDLSSDPNCRLNHLNRLHKWFQHEGKKQTRKERASPSFLMFNKDGQPQPGSARDLIAPSDFATLNLASAVKMRNYPRLEQQLNIQPPPRPPPGYK
mmetsp:Transcript_133653/g.415668  ORF Transcript_133653/g.415668 Transcript_133653/m.415668 type:complete len:271 (-) Transcript_133653:137-949(-)